MKRKEINLVHGFVREVYVCVDCGLDSDTQNRGAFMAINVCRYLCGGEHHAIGAMCAILCRALTHL